MDQADIELIRKSEKIHDRLAMEFYKNRAEAKRRSAERTRNKYLQELKDSFRNKQ